MLRGRAMGALRYVAPMSRSELRRAAAQAFRSTAHNVAKLLDFIDRLRVIIRPAPTVVSPRDTALLSRPDFVPSGFRQGVEILNDDSTPMEFVVSVLQFHLGMSRSEAIRTMLGIHRRGGALLPTSSTDEANRVAEVISSEAANRNHSLICRAVRTHP
jgi:ATP-dependent Clp protease adaptor protein ClpS